MRHRPLWILLLLLGACDGEAPPADAGPRIELGDAGPVEATCPEGEVLTDLSGKPVFGVTVNGRDYRFVWDTGAPTSVLDQALFTELGEGPYDLVIAGHDFTVRSLGVLDLARYGLDGVDGIVGADVLGEVAVTVDFSRRRYWIDDTTEEATLDACDHVAGTPSEIDYLHADYLYVPGRAEGLDGWFLVDTGASLGAMPDSVFDQLDAERPRPALGGFYTAAAIGTFWARLTTVGRLEVAGLDVTHLATRTVRDDLLPAPPVSEGGPFLGVLPSGFLSHFLMTVDYGRGVLRLDPYAGDERREPASFFVVGIGIEDAEEPPVRVAQVLEGSAAEEAGVEVGDVVVDARGYSMASLTPSERPWAFVSQAPGERVAVTVEHGGVERELELEARDLLVSPTD